MNFDDFKKLTVNSIGDYLSEFEISKIKLEPVRKNNGVMLTGLIILRADEMVSPSMYLENYYQYLNNKDFDLTLSKIRDDYIEAHEHMEQMDIKFDVVKENIIMKVVNFDSNKDILDSSPYIRKNDLALTFRVLVNRDYTGISSTQLTYSLMEKYNINLSKDELYELAKANTMKFFPPKIVEMSEMFVNMGMDELDIPNEKTSLYVLTNDAGVNGATCMFYDNVFDEFATEFGDFYIIPSSIHEVILVDKSYVHNSPEDRITKVQKKEDINQFRMMIEEINENVVATEEILSNNLYEYDKDNREIFLADRDDRNKELER